MLIKQISVFIENKSGRLADITAVLGKNGINIHALSIADTTDFGILRLIVDDPDKALKALKEDGLTVKTTEVIGITVSHKPGGLSNALRVLDDAKIAIEYMYAFTGSSKDDKAMVIIRVDNQDKALDVLMNSNINLLDAKAVNDLNE